MRILLIALTMISAIAFAVLAVAGHDTLAAMGGGHEAKAFFALSAACSVALAFAAVLLAKGGE